VISVLAVAEDILTVWTIQLAQPTIYFFNG